MSHEQPIVIIGAGPVGLVTALALLQEGLQVVIYDALPKGLNGSRAAAIHAHTLEQLQTLGYAEELVSRGIKGRGAINYDRTTPLIQITISEYLQGLTDFPFICLIPQHDVEQFFEEKLNGLDVHVKREMSLKGMEEGECGLKLTFENGEAVTTNYLIGADGSRSMVRELARITFANPFNGEPYHMSHHEAIQKSANYLVLADILLEGAYPPTFVRDYLTGTIAPAGIFIIIPLALPDDIDPKNPKSLTFWRVVFDIIVQDELPPSSPDLAYIQGCFDKRHDIWEEKYWPKVSEIRNASRYRAREAMASTMYKPFGKDAHLLLVGDAAHVHSPVGGQGMNLGICDAIALSRRLSNYIKNGKQNTDLFEEYNRNRQVAAKNVIQLATRGLNLIGHITAMPSVIRYLVGSILNHMGFAKKHAALQVSGLVNRAYD